MGDAQRNAVSELVQAAEEINRRPELLQDFTPLFRGPGLFVFPEDPGLSQPKVWLFK